MRQAETYAQPALDDYLKIACGTFSVIGRSIAGVETVFAVPQLGVTFDTGRAPGFAVCQDVLALTHLHPDHAGGLAAYLGLRCLHGLKPLRIVVPKEKRGPVETYLRLMRDVSDSQLAFEVFPADAPVTLRKNLTLEAVPSRHSAPSTGYVVCETRQKLKSRYAGLAAGDIARLRENGEVVTDEARLPLLAFSGDATAEFFTTEAARAEVLLMECSFFGDERSSHVKDYGHTHILDWRDHARRIESRVVVMTHTSMRHSLAEITAYCRKHLPPDLLDRLVLFRNA